MEVGIAADNDATFLKTGAGGWNLVAREGCF